MISQLGWTHISRAAVQRAEAQLAGDSQGVVDELGMLEIHQAYADRFFPGTSVLHTRLRYVLFVAWAYESLRQHRKTQGDISQIIAAQELKLGNTLKRNTDEWGLIGRRTLPRMPAQRPSMMYWSALGTWGMLHCRADGSQPTRAEIHARLARRDAVVMLHDDEGRALSPEKSSFIELPPFPDGWPQGKHINFKLTKNEQKFLRECIGSINQPGTGQLSLLARLANKKSGLRLVESDALLCDEVLSVAGEDLPLIKRAEQAASLAGIVRGIYLVLLEWLCIRDGLNQRDIAMNNLNTLLKEHSKKALALDLDKLKQDIVFRPGSRVPDLLQEVQKWLMNNQKAKLRHDDVKSLMKFFELQERKLKGNRARLPPNAIERRREWWYDKARNDEAPPAPLHYRWHIAVNLLRDLENRG